MENQVALENRKWWIAGAFSFLIPGLGQLYNSQAIKGFVFYFLIFVLDLTFNSKLGHALENPDTLTRPFVIGLLSILIATLLTYLLTIIDAIRFALKSGKNRRPKFYNRWSVYVSILVVFCAFSYLIPQSPGIFDTVKTFKIPSGSMQPTIEAGDYLICNLIYYRSHDPMRGDVIIFKYPRDEKIDYIKRIVGVPGDTVELRDNILLVNGEEIGEPYAVYNDTGNEHWPDPSTYGPYFISENEYFVMGDNRNNSSDSREFGSIERESIEGKAIFVYFSWNMELPLWNIPGRLASIRLSRIGQVL